MRLQLPTSARLFAFVVAALAAGAPAALAQSAETFTGTAGAKSASGVSISAPVTIVISAFATDADRDSLMAALKKGGTAAAKELLAKRGDAGSIQLGARKTALKYAYARSLGSGRLITAVTAEPIVLIGAGLPDAKPKTGYDLGLVLLEVSGSGAGTGELSPAAKVKVDEKGAIVTEDYNAAEVIRLTNVVRK